MAGCVFHELKQTPVLCESIFVSSSPLGNKNDGTGAGRVRGGRRTGTSTSSGLSALKTRQRKKSEIAKLDWHFSSSLPLFSTLTNQKTLK